MTDDTRTPDPLRPRALHCLLRYREPGVTPYRRITRAMEEDLLTWAATLDDADILDMRGVGPTILAWLRQYEPVRPKTNTDTVLGEVMKCNGWRVEIFWNGSADWFTARMVSLVDKEGRRGFEGGYLVPYEDPIGVSANSPGEALANLHDAVLEWA